MKGLDFYARLVDLLLDSGIQPFATLYHWDLPAALDDRGGWTEPETRWSGSPITRGSSSTDSRDRVPMWSTWNEPFMISHAGYVDGSHAPGHHSVVRGRGGGRAISCSPTAPRCACSARIARGSIGLVVNLEPKHPASDAAADVAAAQRADAYMNRQYLDPVLLRRWPDELEAILGPASRAPSDAERAQIAEPIDFVGVNYYSRGITRHDRATFRRWRRACLPTGDR